MVLRILAGALVGLGLTASLGTFDLQRRSTPYYDALHHRVVTLYAAAGLLAVVAIVLVVLWPRLPSLTLQLAARRKRISVLAGWIIAVGLGAAWALRPAGPAATQSATPAHAAAAADIRQLQTMDGLLVSPYRTYAEQTMRWFGWYLGPITVALAIAGLCLLAARVIRSGSPAGLILLTLTGPLTAYYLWNPSITPDQIWATRRFVPVSFPLFVVAAAVTLDAVATFCATRVGDPAWQRRTLAAGAAGLLAFPLATTLPVGKFQPQANVLPLILNTCHKIGPNAVVLFTPHDGEGFEFMQTIRSFCNVPAAQLLTPPAPAQLHHAEVSIRTEGKSLWVLASSPGMITGTLPGVTPQLLGATTSSHELAKTLVSPPSDYATEAFSVYSAELS